jgi:hypothetical protein
MMNEPIVWRPSGIDLTYRTLRRLDRGAWFSDVLVETILHPMLDAIQTQPIRLVLGWNPKWGPKQQRSDYNATVIIMLEQNHFYLIFVSQNNMVEVIDSLATARRTRKAHLEHVHRILGLQHVTPALPGQAIPEDFTFWAQNDGWSSGPIAIHHIFQFLQPITSQNWRDLDPRSLHWRLYLARFIFEHVERDQAPLPPPQAQPGGANEEEEVQIVQPPPRKRTKIGFFSQHLFDATDKITDEEPGMGDSQSTTLQETPFGSARTISGESASNQLKSDHRVIGEAALGQTISAASNPGLANYHAEPAPRTDSNIERENDIELADAKSLKLSRSKRLHLINKSDLVQKGLLSPEMSASYLTQFPRSTTLTTLTSNYHHLAAATLDAKITPSPVTSRPGQGKENACGAASVEEWLGGINPRDNDRIGKTPFESKSICDTDIVPPPTDNLIPEFPTLATALENCDEMAPENLRGTTDTTDSERRKTAEVLGDAPSYLETGINLMSAWREKHILDEKRVIRAEEKAAAATAEKTTAQQANKEEIKRFEAEIQELKEQNRDRGRRLEVLQACMNCFQPLGPVAGNPMLVRLFSYDNEFTAREANWVMEFLKQRRPWGCGEDPETGE